MNKLDRAIEAIDILLEYKEEENLEAALEILKCLKNLLSENNISAMTASYLKLEEVVK